MCLCYVTYALRYALHYIREVRHLNHLVVLRLVYAFLTLADADMCLGVRLCSHLRNHHLSDIIAVLVFCCQRTVEHACHVNIARNNQINNRIVEVDGHILIRKEVGYVVDVNAAEVLKLNLWVELTGSFRYVPKDIEADK